MSKKQLKYWDGAKWRPDPYLPAITLNAAGNLNTVTAITSIPTSVAPGATFTISGTVKTTGGANATTGTVQLQYSVVVGVWEDYSTSMSITAGVFSKTGVTQTTGRLWRASYTAGAGFNDSYSSIKTVTTSTLTTLIATYNTNGTRSYRGDGSNRGTAEIYQGYFDSTNDQQRSVICFPTSIASDLTGAYDIQKVELYLDCLHWGNSSGGTAVVRSHSNTSVPGTWGGVTGLSSDDDRTAWSSKSGSKWCDISQGINSPQILTLSNWTSGAIRGVALYAGSNAAEYYGYFAGNGQANEPKLRITYRKYV
jgi:hypothetical protein